MRRVEAAWFRRKKGKTAACVGYLWGFQPNSFTVEQFLRNYVDNRYGGVCLGRWDGESYWVIEVDRGWYLSAPRVR